MQSAELLGGTVQRSMAAWLIAVGLIIALFVVGPFVGFNRASPFILGMPPLFFWFTFVSLLEPLIIGALYLFESANNSSAAKD